METYKSFLIYRFNNKSYYGLHITDSYHNEADASNTLKEFNNKTFFRITAKSEDIINLFNNIKIIPTKKLSEEDKLLVWIWYIHYYLKFNDIKYNLIINNTNKFTF